MTVLLANIVLAIPFLVAFIAVPLWMTFKHPETGADQSRGEAGEKCPEGEAPQELTTATKELVVL